jgi:MFS family permease|nr:MFS transporter [Kofleriaceae bacterium]
MASLTRALRHRNFRLFFGGQAVSLVGTWLTRFAMAWMAYTLSDSGWQIGLVAFFGQAPSSIIAPFAGVLVDRWNRHRVIVVTQILASLQSAALALFAFTGWMTVWDLMWLGAIQAAINAFDMPARQSFLGQMVEDRADLPNAIALNSSMVNGARLVGPVAAAALVAAFGEGWCFAIDAASYIAVIASLLMMTVPKRGPAKGRGYVWAEMKEGWRYVAHGAPLVRAVLLALTATSVLAGAYSNTLMPLLNGDELGGGEHSLGVLMAAGGCGALCGALYLASRSSIVGLGGVIARCNLGLGASLACLGFVTSVWLATPLVFVLGTCLMVQMASTNTIIQTVVDSDKLGRVMSLYAVSFFGGAPVGALLDGTLASAFGVRPTFVAAGLAAVTCAIVFRKRLPKLRLETRSLYVRLGLIEE